MNIYVINRLIKSSFTVQRYKICLDLGVLHKSPVVWCRFSTAPLLNMKKTVRGLRQYESQACKCICSFSHKGYERGKLHVKRKPFIACEKVSLTNSISFFFFADLIWSFISKSLCKSLCKNPIRNISDNKEKQLIEIIHIILKTYKNNILKKHFYRNSMPIFSIDTIKSYVFNFFFAKK